jgi:hypothetical protein
MKKFKDLNENIHLSELLKDYKNLPPNSDDISSVSNIVSNRNDLVDRLKRKLNDSASKESIEQLKRYTDTSGRGSSNSKRLNSKLIKGEELSNSDKKMHDGIMNSIHKAGEDVHLYSGISPELGENIHKSKNNIIISPAHISTSLSPKIASNFAKGNEYKHMIHVHVKPDDKIVHVSGLSHFPYENETIIPAGTKLKYSHTTEHKNPNDSNKKYKVHHLTIEKSDVDK